MSRVASVRPHRFLIVEDELLISLVLEDILTDLGHEIAATAPTVDEALQKMDDTAFDGAFLDINLGGTLSFAVADVLAARDVPFAFSTGYRPDTIPGAHRDRPLIGKPVSPADVERALAAMFPGDG